MAVEVGRRLRWSRLALGHMRLAPKLQKDFADSLGLTKSKYNNYETGYVMLAPDVAVRIYGKYGISLNWLYAADETWLPGPLQDAIDRMRAEHP